jgi:hypothetical protein
MSMKLKGVKPSLIKKRFKAFFYGPAGCGKTTAAIQFPCPYLIDTEKGAENPSYTRILDANGGAILQTFDFEEILNEIRTLSVIDHPYKTLIIDPLTHVYDELLYQSQLKVGTQYNKHYGEANRNMKRLFRMLEQIDMNVILTAHEKKVYLQNEVAGTTFDCYGKSDYTFDAVFEIQTRGQNRTARVIKSRLEGFEKDSTFPFSFDEIALRYGADEIERVSVPLPLATEEQLSQFYDLKASSKFGDDMYSKWLEKAKCEKFDEMTSDMIGKCIEFLIKNNKDN